MSDQVAPRGNQLNIYTSACTVLHRGEFRVVTGVIVAPNEKLALERAKIWLFINCPEEKGYKEHRISVLAIEESALQEAGYHRD